MRSMRRTLPGEPSTHSIDLLYHQADSKPKLYQDSVSTRHLQHIDLTVTANWPYNYDSASTRAIGLAFSRN